MPGAADWSAIEDAVLGFYQVTDTERLVQKVKEVVLEATDGVGAAVYLFDADWDDLYIPAAPGREPVRFPAGDGIAGWVAKKQGLYVCKDIDRDPLYQEGIDIGDDAAVVAAPLVAAAGAFVGVLEVSYQEQPPENVIEAVMFIARHGGNAYISAEAHAAETNFSRSIARSYGTAVDALDPQTSDHSQRVARYAAELGKAMGLPHDRIRVLEMSAYLHDVGKTLLSSRSLDGKPQEAPKYLHLVLSEAFLMMVEFPPGLADIPRVVKEHHEYWDGSGVPDGLAGDAALQESRILCVVNDFDALRQGWLIEGQKATLEEAVEYIKNEADGLYDPEAVEAFLDSAVHEMDLRSHNRYEYRTPIEIENLSNTEQDRFSGVAADISEGGLLIESKGTAAVGDLLRIFIYLPSGEPLEAIVRVARSTGDGEKHMIGVHYIWHAAQQGS
ncbi:MAG: PilZ domain-containing protein [Planctomycetes bacterium]|nr:PilZ domain-containing protein [Planctomycetota bacterium]